ncbi:hypothetical protein SBADM41S_07469 [Streptomyces badius]
MGGTTGGHEKDVRSTAESVAPNPLPSLLTRQQQKPGREETRRAGRWRIHPPHRIGDLPRIGRPRRQRHRKNIRYTWPHARTGLLRSGTDGSPKVGRCPFGALSRPFPSSAPDRIRQSSRLILAESHPLGAFTPHPWTAMGHRRFTGKKRYQTHGVPGAPSALSPAPRPMPPGCRLPCDGVLVLFTRKAECAWANGNRGEESRPGRRGQGYPAYEGPERAGSLPRVQAPGTYSRPARPVKTGR